jgi:hypothetical protein
LFRFVGFILLNGENMPSSRLIGRSLLRKTVSATLDGLLDVGQLAILETSRDLAVCPISADILGYANSVRLSCCGSQVTKSAIKNWAETMKKEYKTPSCPFDRNEVKFAESLTFIGVDPIPLKPSEGPFFEMSGPLAGLLGDLPLNPMTLLALGFLATGEMSGLAALQDSSDGESSSAGGSGSSSESESETIPQPREMGVVEELTFMNESGDQFRVVRFAIPERRPQDVSETDSTDSDLSDQEGSAP